MAKKPTKKPTRKGPPKTYGTYQSNPNYRGKKKRSKGSSKRSSARPRRVRKKRGGLVRRLIPSFIRVPKLRRGPVFNFLSRMAMWGFIVVGLVLAYFAATLPDIREIDTIRKQQGITIQTEDGRTIANYGDVYGEYIPYDKIPKSLVYAVLATEDRRFFEHHGVDFFGIARAMVTNVSHGRVVQGGSTVTQQVAKNVFLTPERSAARKIQELLLAFWLEGRFSKKEIMAIYLNRVYLGSGAFGIDAASRRYFNKSAKDLTLEESALLAGLLKAPSRYSPASNSTRAKERMHQVLVNMQDAGYLKKKDVDLALANYTKTVSERPVEGGDIRYFTDWVLDELPDVVGTVEEDLVVTTTVDTKMQAAATDALQNTLAAQGPKLNASQGALVSMTPDGAVKAMVGGLSYAESQYNRAAQAKRQPGSSFKIFVYLAALEAGLTPLSMVEDSPITLQVGNKTWSPNNYSSGQYLGEIPMVEALRNSLNTVSVRLGLYAGINRVAEMAERMGIPNVPNAPSITLGSAEATLVEMTGAYAHLANGGKKVVPYGILSVKTRKGVEIYKHEETEQPQVLASGTVQMMNYMLLNVVTSGTGTKARLKDRQVAGKTGTTSDYKDAWFVGFTSQLVTGVWVGNDDNKPMKKVTGGTLPAPIFREFMTKASEGMPVKGIPASAESSDGLFPWLFGGSSASQPEGEQGQNPGVYNPQAAPAVEERPATGGEPAQQGGDVLTPQFWNKLMDTVPERGDVKVEYEYPGDAESGRRR